MCVCVCVCVLCACECVYTPVLTLLFSKFLHVKCVFLSFNPSYGPGQAAVLKFNSFHVAPTSRAL